MTSPKYPLLVLGVIVLLGLNAWIGSRLGGAGEAGFAYRLGTWVGAAVFVLLIVLVVYGIARAMKRARSAAGAMQLAFWTLLALAALNFGVLRVGALLPRATLTVTAAERANLDVGPDAISHAGFHFTIPHPGGAFSADPQIQGRLDSALAPHPGIAGWAFSDSLDGQRTLVLQVTKLGDTDSVSFAAFVRGIRNGVTQRGQLRPDVDVIDWSSGGAYQLSVPYPSGLYLRMQCLRRLAGAATVIVCAQTTGTTAADMDAVRLGLRVTPDAP